MKVLIHACDHFEAEATGTCEARQLPDGHWEYRTAYACLACGARFVERHTQPLAADARFEAESPMG